MNAALKDLLVLVNELVENLGGEVVADGMSNQGWLRPDSDKIPELVIDYFENQVFDDEYDDIMSEVYNEFHNIAAQNDYTIKTTY